MNLTRAALALVIVIPFTTATPAQATTTSNAAQKLVTTNGDILALEMLYLPGGNQLAIGGNFTTITAHGTVHAARNFAIVNTTTGALTYAGNVNGFVRSIGAVNGVVYIGGDFTAPRRYAAAYDLAWHLTAWAPVLARPVFALSCTGSTVYLGTTRNVQAVTPGRGDTLWTLTVGGGPVRALLARQDINRLFIGGLFETPMQHGLIATTLAGTLVTDFTPTLHADSGIGPQGSYDGEEVLALGFDPLRGRLLLCDGGAITNWFRTVEWRHGSGAGIEYTHHQTIGDCQTTQNLGDAYFTGWHNNHPQGWPGVQPAPYFAGIWAADNAALLPWDGRLLGPNRAGPGGNDGGNGGVQASVLDRQALKLYVGGAHTHPWASLAVFQVTL